MTQMDLPEAQSSDYYRTRFTENPNRSKIWRHITRYLESFWALPAESSALELGAGYGAWIDSIRCKKKFALDVHPSLPQILNEQNVTGVEAVVGECTDLSRWPNASLDLLLASNLLEHLPMSEAGLSLEEAARVLKPGGYLTLIQPNFALCPRQYFDDYTHQTIFTHVSLRDLVRAKGFETIRLWKRFLPLTMKSRGSSLSFLVPLYLRSPWKPLAGQMCLLARKPGEK